MELKELVLKNRSRRRFHQEQAIARETLVELVDLARLSPSGANRQPLKFKVVAEPEENAKVFACLGWAGYLKDWSGPEQGERPAGYIVVLGDRELNSSFGAEGYGVDHGIAAQSIMLGAVERGLGGCILASVRRAKLREALELSEDYDILLVLALGVPKEDVVVDPVADDGGIRYWRDEGQVHHVPKRSLEELII